jgi:hypothetical protein
VSWSETKWVGGLIGLETDGVHGRHSPTLTPVMAHMLDMDLVERSDSKARHKPGG